MDVEPKAVAESMTEVLAVSGFSDDFSRYIIDFATRHAGADRVDGGHLCFEHDLIDTSILRRNFTDVQHSRQVTPVKVFASPPVKQDEIMVARPSRQSGWRAAELLGDRLPRWRERHSLLAPKSRI